MKGELYELDLQRKILVYTTKVDNLENIKRLENGMVPGIFLSKNGKEETTLYVWR